MIINYPIFTLESSTVTLKHPQIQGKGKEIRE